MTVIYINPDHDPRAVKPGHAFANTNSSHPCLGDDLEDWPAHDPETIRPDETPTIQGADIRWVDCSSCGQGRRAYTMVWQDGDQDWLCGECDLRRNEEYSAG